MSVVSQVFTLQSAAAATGNGTTAKVNGAGVMVFDVTITGTATITFEQAGLSDAWVAINDVYNVATGANGTTATATGQFRCSVAGVMEVRARISSYSSGTVTVTAVAAPYPMWAGQVYSNYVSADTELPAAAALADNVANPTTPMIGAGNMVWDEGGSVWHRARGLKNDLTNLTGTHVPAMALVSTTGASWRPITQSGAGAQSYQRLAVAVHGYNGSTYDHLPVNSNVTILASAARTATPSKVDQTNYGFRGGHFIINVTSVTDTPSVTPTIQGKDPISGTYYTILAGTAITGTGITILKVYPGITASANASASDVLPRTWAIDMTHADTDSITYSVAFVGVV